MSDNDGSRIDAGRLFQTRGTDYHSTDLFNTVIVNVNIFGVPYALHPGELMNFVHWITVCISSR